MKKTVLFLGAFILLSLSPSKTGITKKERKYAIQVLEQTRDELISSLKNLSVAQIRFKPVENRWSIEECVKHIAAAEIMLWQMTNGKIQEPANAEKRVEIKMTDEDVMIKGADRGVKVKTAPSLEPQNTPFANTGEAIISFKDNRDKLIGYVKNTDADLRNHVATLPFGSLDCYQMILFMAAHTRRHTAQIEEIKMGLVFPKQ
ncbi:MAG TPA: DinB family protein [Agriterribacter sp.]|nr:DinB family protein [Agriterribacter sp.]